MSQNIQCFFQKYILKNVDKIVSKNARICCEILQQMYTKIFPKYLVLKTDIGNIYFFFQNKF